MTLFSVRYSARFDTFLRLSLADSLDSSNFYIYVPGLDIDDKVVILTTTGDFY